MSDGSKVGGRPQSAASIVSDTFADDAMVNQANKDKDLKKAAEESLKRKSLADRVKDAQRVQATREADGKDKTVTKDVKKVGIESSTSNVRAKLQDPNQPVPTAVDDKAAVHQAQTTLLALEGLLSDAKTEVGADVLERYMTLRGEGHFTERVDAAEARKLGLVDGEMSDAEVARIVGCLTNLIASQEGKENQLRDLVQQLFTGDYGFSPTRDPLITFDRLFREVDRWPATLPPHRPPAGDKPWDSAAVDGFLDWLYSVPPMPADIPARWP